MPAPRARDVTGWLLAWNAGEPGALDQLVPLVFVELCLPSAVTTTPDWPVATPPPGMMRRPQPFAPPPEG